MTASTTASMSITVGEVICAPDELGAECDRLKQEQGATAIYAERLAGGYIIHWEATDDEERKD